MRRWGLLALVAVAGCSTVREPVPPPVPPVPSARRHTEEGLASWYGPGFHGRRTANGEIYDQEGMTAAHKTLPLGSRVSVTRTDTEQSLELRINDRGPFVDGRIIDLSKAAARELDVLQSGVAPVRVTVLEWGDNKYVRSPRRRSMDVASRRSRPVAADTPPPAAAPPAPAPTTVAAAPRPAPPVPTEAPPAPARHGANRPIPSEPQPILASALSRRAPAAPAAVPVRYTEPRDVYSVQVAMLTDEQRAQHLASVLRGRFPATHVSPLTTSEGRWYRVQIGPFDARATAREQAERVTRLGYPAVIVAQAD